MSKLFAEIIEQGVDNPKIVKLEVKDKQEALDKIAIEEIKFVGLDYVKRIHTCRHDENLSCEAKNL